MTEGWYSVMWTLTVTEWNAKKDWWHLQSSDMSGATLVTNTIGNLPAFAES